MHNTNDIAPVARDDTLPIRHVVGVLPGSKDGKGIGELVDDATVTAWAESYLTGQPVDTAAADEQVVAFRFGVRAEGRFAGLSFAEAESDLRSEWSSELGRHTPWVRARDAVWAGFDRARDRRV